MWCGLGCAPASYHERRLCDRHGCCSPDTVSAERAVFPRPRVDVAEGSAAGYELEVVFLLSDANLSKLPVSLKIALF